MNELTLAKTLIVICLGFLSFSAIQQFELAFEGKLRCDFIKTIIMIVFTLSVSYYPTLPYNSENLERILRADL